VALKERILSLAGFKLEAAPADLEIVNDRMSVRGATAKSVLLPDVTHLRNFGEGFGWRMTARSIAFAKCTGSLSRSRAMLRRSIDLLGCAAWSPPPPSA